MFFTLNTSKMRLDRASSLLPFGPVTSLDPLSGLGVFDCSGACARSGEEVGGSGPVNTPNGKAILV